MLLVIYILTVEKAFSAKVTHINASSPTKEKYNLYIFYHITSFGLIKRHIIIVEVSPV